MSKVHIARQGYLTKSALPNVSRTGIVPASLLLLGNGTNGSTNIIDSSPNALTVTRVGSPVISTASFPTGMSSSINFPSGASYLRLAQNAALFDIAADFTFECYINYSAHDGSGGIIAAAGPIYPTWTGWQIQFDGTSDRLTFACTPLANPIISSTTLSRNAWNHVAVSRISGVMRMFFNGTNVGQANNTTVFTNNASFVYVANERSPGLGFTGYLSNVRVFNTVGLYSANFTPPSLPLTNTTSGTITNNTYGVYQNY